VATGVKVANPELSVWVVTGDGDGLSIGGNHLLHLLRRNVNVTVLLFNNRIYGLTKGQYSPTSPEGTRTKTTPGGSVDHPLNPLLFALGAEATFIARTVDNNPKHMVETFKAAHEHQGVSFVEIFQNCVIFNDAAWDPVYAKENRDDQMLFLEAGKPLLFGRNKDKAVRLNGLAPEICDAGEPGVLIHQPDQPALLADACQHGPAGFPHARRRDPPDRTRHLRDANPPADAGRPSQARRRIMAGTAPRCQHLDGGVMRRRASADAAWCGVRGAQASV
jgi:hypothetical protein